MARADGETSQKTLHVAIAGLGVASNQILPAMTGTSGVQLVAAADIRPQAREAFREKYGGHAYETVEALCQDPQVDAIWVSTPNQFHCEHTITAAQHGKHIVVEKPMALTLDEAEKMVEAVERNGVQLLCGHTQSFNPDIQQMARMIAKKELGALAAINIWSYTDWMLRARMPQEVDPESGGGVVYRQGPHQVDTARLLGGGMVRSVRAMAGQWMPERPCPGYYSAYLEFENGTPALITHNGYGYFVLSEFFLPDHASVADRYKARQQLRQGLRKEAEEKEQARFGGERARREGGGQLAPDVGIVVGSCERGDLRTTPSGGLMIYDDEGQREVPVAGVSSSRSTELIEMRDAVANNRPVFHNGRWGMATLEVILAILQSGQERREIMMSHQSPAQDHFYSDRS